MVALANYAHEEFDMAVLESPYFDDGDTVHCFKFYYNFQVSFFSNPYLFHNSVVFFFPFVLSLCGCKEFS